MVELLGKVANVAVLVFVVSCMVAAGLGLSGREVIAPLRRGRLVVLALLANFVLAPGLAYGISEAASLQEPHAIGIILLGSAAGAPFLPKLAELCRGDLAFSVGLMLLLMIGSVIFMPTALPFMIPGLEAAPWPLLKPLLFTMLAPLAIGMAVRSRSVVWSARLRPGAVLVSNASMIVAVVLLIALNFQPMLGTFGSGAAAAGGAFVALTLALGYVLGGPAPETRSVLGLGTAQRNVAAALLLATQNFSDKPDVTIMILITTLVGLAILLVAAKRMVRSSSRAATAAVASNPAEHQSGEMP